MNPIIYIVAGGVLVVGVAVMLVFRRNPFNKHQYLRIVRFHTDMSETVSYVKRDKFNQRHEILINPKNIFNFKGYQTLILTSESNETINPLDFTSKFSAEDFKTAMRSNLIKDAFQGLQVEKFDKLMLLIIINAVTLIGVAYMLYSMMSKK